ncbi:MAG: hypothetical protein Q8L49_12005 [Burkholderiaceae bacterium]|nr:hypothetical protein [Burkholderiaceae bacterium]
MFNQHCRATCAQYAVSERCHLEPRRYRLRDAPQFTDGLHLTQEITQITVFHIRFRSLFVETKYLTGYYEAS